MTRAVRLNWSSEEGWICPHFEESRFTRAFREDAFHIFFHFSFPFPISLCISIHLGVSVHLCPRGPGNPTKTAITRERQMENGKCSGLRVSLIIDLDQFLHRNMCVDLRRRKTGMTEKLLNVPQVCAAIQ